jgi:glycosyltransferase involved in cell wall biosynthesis
MMLVSVVIPTYRRPHLLGRCLSALASQCIDPRLFEIVVVDDGHSRSTRDVVDRFAEQQAAQGPAIRYVEPQGTRGPAGARNAGWRLARAPVIAFTDDDTIPAEDWLEHGLRAMTPGIAAAWGYVRVPLSDHPTDYERNVHQLEGAEFVTANCFVRRDALLNVAGFDPRFTRAWREDSDLYFSLLEHAHAVVSAPAAVVLHPLRPAGWGVSLRQHTNLVFDALLYKKHRRLYREKIGSGPPIKYYLTVLALLLLVILLIAGKPWLAGAAGLVWLGLTTQFCAKRLRGTVHTKEHVLEMVMTSIAIPFCAVFWRLAGAFRYRVLFA